MTADRTIDSRTDNPEPHRVRRVVAHVLARSSLVFVLVALVVLFAAIDGSDFFSADNLKLVLSTNAAVGAVSLGVTVALTVGEIDLSVAGVMGSVAGIAALLVSEGTNSWTAMLIGLAFAGGFGLLNGLLITVAKLPSIIATLATGTLTIGFGLAIVGPSTISGLNPDFLNLFSSEIGGVQTAFFLLLAITAAGMLVLGRTRLGRRIFFVGENESAAALVGIRVQRTKLGAMIVSALLAGFAGIMLVGQNGGANVTQTSGYLLPAFAATYLGSSVLVPGRFNPGGTFIAVYVLGVATVGLNTAGVPPWSTYVFNGALLIVALGLFTLVKLRKDRQAKRESRRAVETREAHNDAEHGLAAVNG